jgi:DNA-binding CsgD family transcriptional regulator
VERLKGRDLRAVLDLVREAHAVLDLDTFTRHVTAALPALIPCELATWNEINPARGRIHYLLQPAEVDFAGSREIFERHLHEHPIIAHYRTARRQRPRRISDFLTQRQYHRLGLYNELFRRFRIEYLMAAPLPTRPPLQLGFGLCRSGRDFSERERTMAELLAPHLGQAYRNAEIVSELPRLVGQALDTTNRTVVLLGPDGRVKGLTDRARRYFARYWDAPSRGPDRLPQDLARWVSRQAQGLGGPGEGMSPPGQPLVIERDGTRLVVRFWPGSWHSMLVLESQRTAPDAARLAALGLTRREAEVLNWVADGKTNDEIGVILGAGRRTVEKHLERVLRKLGVETRTAAARVALTTAAPPD